MNDDDCSTRPSVLPVPFANTDPPPTLVTQGAEALLYKTCFLTSDAPAALKFRPSKAYRHPTLDARLTKQRVLAEARVLVKLSSLADRELNVPAVLSLEWDVGRKVKGLTQELRGVPPTPGTGAGHGGGQGAWLLMEWIEGKSVKELLRERDIWAKTASEQQYRHEEEIKKLLRRIGRAVAAMHSKGGIVHGDLTSSNIMIRPTTQPQPNGHIETGPPSLEGEIVLIDFGLATQASQDEDRAVDLYVLERAFGSTHPKQEEWFDQEVLQSPEGYKGGYKGASVVLKRLDEVRLRGRKRSMVG
jgi:TP53 regulating kinase and related kinases